LNLSSFPSQIDSFIERQEIHANDVALMEEYETLLKKTRTPIEDIRLLELTNLLRDKILMSGDVNKIQDSVINIEDFFLNQTVGYLQTKQTEFQAEIDKFTDKGVYNPTTQYYAKNYVTYNDGTGDNVYLCFQSCLNILPTNASYWRRLGIKGAKGNDGVGLIFKGAWNNTTVYNANEAVQFGGMIFGAIQANTNQQPNLTTDTSYWAKAWDLMVVTTKLKGYRSITVGVSNVNFMVGTINAFNPSTDTLEVFLNSTALTEGIDYVINANNQSIDKIGGTWNGTVEIPRFFDFRVIRNQINSLVFTDGQVIEDRTISKNKLSIDVQNEVDKISILSGASGTNEKLNKATFDSYKTTNDTNITNINTSLADILTKQIMLKRKIRMGGLI
jgi:hypothetical protein